MGVRRSPPRAAWAASATGDPPMLTTITAVLAGLVAALLSLWLGERGRRQAAERRLDELLTATTTTPRAQRFTGQPTPEAETHQVIEASLDRATEKMLELPEVRAGGFRREQVRQEARRLLARAMGGSP
jgi:hypothetical protein